jgi:putative membrane protein
MKFAFAMGIFAVALIQATGAGATPSANDFRHQAMASDAFEIASSKIALGQSQNPHVKSFAHMMIHDHSLTTKHLLSTQSTLTQSDIDSKIATDAHGMHGANDLIDQSHADMLNKLGNEKAKDFDSDYMSDQVSGHEDAVSLFNDYATNGDDRGLKHWAGKTLPKLKMHLSKATSVKKSL